MRGKPRERQLSLFAVGGRLVVVPDCQPRSNAEVTLVTLPEPTADEINRLLDEIAEAEAPE